ncbi:MAG: hypothetical protein H8E73_03050 [Planctomycetes bacterium]|nr:hypothetical protein [Planctomycetota bacterium]
MNRELVVFHGKIMTVARNEFAASCDGKDAEPFVDSLYEQYNAAGRPEVYSWLKAELGKHFLCVDERPQWVEEEPCWPYLEGKPMIFISQVLVPENDVTKEHLTWDTVIYLFGSRVPSQRGHRVEYRVVDQIRGFGGV